MDGGLKAVRAIPPFKRSRTGFILNNTLHRDERWMESSLAIEFQIWSEKR